MLLPISSTLMPTKWSPALQENRLPHRLAALPKTVNSATPGVTPAGAPTITSRATPPLVGFQRVSVPAGEARTVQIAVPVAALRRWDEAAKACVVDPGACRLAIGPASAKELLQAKLTVSR
jgi:hypothetical protein